MCFTFPLSLHVSTKQRCALWTWLKLAAGKNIKSASIFNNTFIIWQNIADSEMAKSHNLETGWWTRMGKRDYLQLLCNALMCKLHQRKCFFVFLWPECYRKEEMGGTPVKLILWSGGTGETQEKQERQKRAKKTWRQMIFLIVLKWAPHAAPETFCSTESHFWFQR